MQTPAVLYFIGLVLCVRGWQNDDFELYDLVEEVGRNFYDVLELTQGASDSDIRKAYRRLSLQYHPDKNKEKDAEEKFRQIAAIADILKDEERRKQYDLILQNGLPDWREPVFYYRRVRKMGLWELFFFLFVLLTLGQYLLAWSMYWERKYELEEVFMSKFRKKEKRGRRTKMTDTSNDSESSLLSQHLSQLPKPRYQDLLVMRLASFLLYLVKSAPSYYQRWRESCLHRSPNAEDDSDEEYEVLGRVRKPRRRIKDDLPDYSCIMPSVDAPSNGSSENEDHTLDRNSSSSSQEKSVWTDADTVALTRAMTKYPGGTLQRWEKIAHLLGRDVDMVIAMAKKVKLSFYTKVPTALQGVTGSGGPELESEPTVEMTENYEISEPQPHCRSVAKEKKLLEKPAVIPQIHSDTKRSNSEDSSEVVKRPPVDDSWSQHQQKSLELALQQFPKGTEDRWDRVAHSVPGKSKEECMMRFKFLAELIRKKKAVKSS